MRASKLLAPLLVGAIGFGCLSFATTRVLAQTISWARTGTDFNTGANWTGGVVPGPSAIASFAGNANASIQPTLSTSATLAGLQFTVSFGPGYIFSGGPGVTLTFGGASPVIDMTGNFGDSGGASQTITVPVIFSGTSATVTTSTLRVVTDFNPYTVPDFASKSSPGISFNNSIGGPNLTSLTLSGRVSLNGGSYYTGTTNLGTSSKASYTTIGQPNAFGYSTVAVSGVGHTLQTVYNFTGANKVLNNFAFSNSGELYLDAANLELGGNISVTGGTAKIHAIERGTVTLSGVISGDAGVSFSGVAAYTPGDIPARRPGGLFVTGTNTFTGNVAIAGLVTVSSIGNSGVAGPLGQGSSIDLTGGNLYYTGTGETTNRTISVTASNQQTSLENWGTGALVLSGAITPNGLLRVLNVGGDNMGENRIVNPLVNTGSASVSLAVTGGRWILPANVSAGQLGIEGATVRIDGSGLLSSGALGVGAMATLDLNGTSQTVGGMAMLNGSVMSTGGGGTLTAASFEMDTSSSAFGAANISVSLAGPGGLTTKGTTTLTGLNTYQGKTSITGSLTINSIGNVGGGPSALGAPTTVSNGTIDLRDFLRYTGPAASTDRGFNLPGGPLAYGGTIENNGTGPLTLNGSLTSSATNPSLIYTLAGNTYGNTINGLISNGTTVVTVAKVGSGSWALTANNTYSGGTQIVVGTLSAQAGHALGSGPVSLLPTGTLNLFSDPGNSVGTLTVNSFTWNGGSNLVFDLGAPGVSDQLAITNAFTRGTGNGRVFDFQSGGSLGTYTLLTFGSLSGFTAGDASAFSYINLNPGLVGTFALTPTSLTFTTAIPEPSTYAAIFGGVALAAAVWRRRRVRQVRLYA